jgi:hypothetical protein
VIAPATAKLVAAPLAISALSTKGSARCRTRSARRM